MPNPIGYLQSGAIFVLMSGELNSLANNNLAPGLVAYDNTSGYLMGEVQFTGPAASYAASTGFSIWFLRCVVSGTYEDGTSGYTPTRIPDVVIPLQSGSKIVTRRVPIPPAMFTPLFKNDGTGVTMSSSGNILRLLPLTFQQTSN